MNAIVSSVVVTGECELADTICAMTNEGLATFLIAYTDDTGPNGAVSDVAYVDATSEAEAKHIVCAWGCDDPLLVGVASPSVETWQRAVARLDYRERRGDLS